MKTSVSTTNLIACAVIIGAVTAGFATGPAFGQEAAPGAEPFKFQFDYQPGELTNAPAAEKLLVRLHQDVRARCGGGGKMTLDERSRVNACINETMQDTVGKFGSSAVAQAYQSRTGG